MNDRQKYFLKQKLAGIVMLVLAAVSVILLEGDITAAVVFVPMGLMLLFSKKMIWEDEFKFEEEEREWNERL